MEHRASYPQSRVEFQRDQQQERRATKITEREPSGMNRPMSTLGFWCLSAMRSPSAFKVRDWVSVSVHISFKEQKDLRDC